jgi:hypothetical protein
MNVSTIEKCLNSNHDKYPSREATLINLINTDMNLDALVLFDDILGQLLEFTCNHKSDINEQAIEQMLRLKDIIHPVMDDDTSYQKRVGQLITSHDDLEEDDFPTKVEELMSLQSVQVYGYDLGQTHYAYSIDDLIKMARNNKQH